MRRDGIHSLFDLPNARIVAPDTRYTEHVQQLRNDPATAFLLINRAVPSTSERVEEWIRSYSPPRHLFFITSLDGTDFLGYLTVSITDTVSGVAEIGIAMAEHARGRGIGPDAIAAICKYCRATLAIHKLVAHVLAKNEPSLRVFEGQGFERAGLLKEHFFAEHEYWDVVVLELVFPDADRR